MRRRRQTGLLTSLTPYLAILSLAQGISAGHDGDKPHRRSRTRNLIEERQLDVDAGLLSLGIVDVVVPTTSSSPSMTFIAGLPTPETTSSVSTTSSSITTSVSTTSVAPFVWSATESSSSTISSIAAVSSSSSSDVFMVMTAAQPAATTDSSSRTSVENTGGAVRPNTPGQPVPTTSSTASSTISTISTTVPVVPVTSPSTSPNGVVTTSPVTTATPTTSPVTTPITTPGMTPVTTAVTTTDNKPPTTIVAPTTVLPVSPVTSPSSSGGSGVGGQDVTPVATTTSAATTVPSVPAAVSTDPRPPTTLAVTSTSTSSVPVQDTVVAPSSTTVNAQTTPSSIVPVVPVVSSSSSSDIVKGQPTNPTTVNANTTPSSVIGAVTTTSTPQTTPSSISLPLTSVVESILTVPSSSSSSSAEDTTRPPPKGNPQTSSSSSATPTTVFTPPTTLSSPSDVTFSSTSAGRPVETVTPETTPSSSSRFTSSVDAAASNARVTASSSSIQPVVVSPAVSTGSSSSSVPAISPVPSSIVASPVVTSAASSEAWTSPVSSTASPKSSSSSSKEDIYVPTQTWLIVAATSSTSSGFTTSTTPKPSQTGSSTTAQLPSTAVIPNSVPTLIVPANSAAYKANAGTGTTDDPLKDTTLISLLLAADQYPWTFVVKSSDATTQLLLTFPQLVGDALQIPVSEVQTYGLQVYQPASWNGDQAALLTQWLAYIPEDKFDTLNAYLKAGQNSPLFNQTGIPGQLSAQINTAFPLAANSETAPSTTTTTDSKSSNTRTRDIIIGVCVGIGGLLWIGLVFWIYKRIKRNNDRAVHKRLSEHMSMFDDREREQRRMSAYAPSLAPSDVDDRPSSFYASPVENDPMYRRQQRRSLDIDSAHHEGSQAGSGGSDAHSPTYHPSVFGSSWFANSQGSHGRPEMRQQPAQNPFEDIVTRSYLQASGSAGGLGSMAQRRSAPGRPVQKAMIGQPTLHASSLEFREQ